MLIVLNVFFAVIALAMAGTCTYVLFFTIPMLPEGSSVLVSKPAIYAGIISLSSCLY